MALESLRHEQLPEVLRGEFLHVLAVVVNLPCWRGATCIHTPTHKNTPTEANIHTYIHVHKQAQAGEGREEKQKHSKTVQLVGGNGVNGRDQDVV